VPCGTVLFSGLFRQPISARSFLALWFPRRIRAFHPVFLYLLLPSTIRVARWAVDFQPGASQVNIKIWFRLSFHIAYGLPSALGLTIHKRGVYV
jgi:hypothetical protein